MNASLGLAHFWAQGDAVSHTVALALLLMSVWSWTVMLGKVWAHWRVRHTVRVAAPAFWAAPSREAALTALRAEDASGVFAGLALASTPAPMPPPARCCS